MEEVRIMVDTQCTGDAERDAIGLIPQALKNLPENRAIAILEYLLGRYKSGDNCSLK